MKRMPRSAETEAVRLMSVGTKLLPSIVSGAMALGGALAPNAVVIIGASYENCVPTVPT